MFNRFKNPGAETAVVSALVPVCVAKFQASADVVAHLGGQELFVQDLYAGADPAYRLSVRFVQELAWHNLFVRNLFIVPPAADLARFQPQFTTAPSFKADPARHGTRSDVVIALNLAAREVIIAGTSYAGENKKSIFTVLNYVLPLQGVLAMHCSANIGPDGDTALFFGLSGTGKTTLSSDAERQLIGVVIGHHEAAGVAVQHLKVGQQVVGEQHRLRALQMGVPRRDCIDVLLRQRDDGVLHLAEALQRRCAR